MFENITKLFKKITNKNDKTSNNSKEAAKERLHLVLMQDRANVSADFLELMKQEIIEVIKKYIDVDEGAIDVRLTNKENEDGTNGAPALYANIPIVNIKNEARKAETKEKNKEEEKQEANKEKKEKKDIDLNMNKSIEKATKIMKQEQKEEKASNSEEEKSDKVNKEVKGQKNTEKIIKDSEEET